MTDQERRHLVQADRHIAECQRQIACQKELIRQIGQRGESTLWAEDMLDALQASLRAFEKHRAFIVAQMMQSDDDAADPQARSDARTYMLGLARELLTQWQRACELLLAEADVVAFSAAVELALFYDAKLDVAAMRVEC